MNERITRSDTLPNPSDLRDAYELELRSPKGKPVRLGELVLDKVRHFFCAYDQDYVRTIAHALTDSLLKTLPHTNSNDDSNDNNNNPTQLIIIGCGHPALIVPYVAETAAPFPVYTDPRGALYEKLHMTRTVRSIMRPPSYATVGFWRALGTTFRQMAAAGWRGVLGGGGSWAQNGGEWVFRGGKCVYVHRMENVSDHLTAEELMRVMGER
ncbi:peroxiredoxin-like family protein [Aspergillus lucknowensis]|uniref:AhpC/TSA antioxidant enzyme-domain-containing protein n=1 Tax=Aspergillus lucknowensis TaxID=176173 RepID=A0ABR4LFF6_9EURO